MGHSRHAKRRSSLIRTIFEALYRWGDWVYDPVTVTFFGSDWHRWRQTAVPYLKPSRILEIGCGTGTLLKELDQRFDHITGIDLSSSMTIAARKRAPYDAGVVQASANDLPFPGETFDSVVSTFPASYINRQETLDEIARVLKPGGKFVVVTSAEFSRFRWSRLHTHLLMRLAYGQGQSLSRFPSKSLSHPDILGEWIDAPTNAGPAHLWVGTKTPGG